MPARDNGLPASRYVPLVDLDPQLADVVLEALRVEGIAGYADPAPGVVGGLLETHLPDRPTDRVWVDAEAEERARLVVDGLRQGFAAGTGPASRQETEGQAADPAADLDAAWEAIVAGYGDQPAQPGQGRPLRRAGPEEPSELGDPAAPAAPAEDHFVPPPPPPLPTTDTITKLAWAGVVGGPAVLLIATMTGLSERAAAVAVAGFVAGFVTLVARMKDRPPADSDPDDGAVV